MSQVTLDRLRIATPCPMNWEEMAGDDAVRFCSKCSLNVYNVAQMSREEAETLLANSEGRVCMRLFRRHDGTIITRDCPVGRKALHRQVLALAGGVLALFFVLSAGALASVGIVSQREWNAPSNWDFFGWFNNPYNGPETGDICMGEPLPTVPPSATTGGPSEDEAD